MNNPSFHSSRNAGAIRTYQWYCLSLHVAAHEGAVCVVMLKEGDQRGRNPKYLRRQEVNIIDLAGRKLFRENFTAFAALPGDCLLYTSPSPRDRTRSRMPSSA